MNLPIIHICVLVFGIISTLAHGHGHEPSERQLGPAPIEHRPLPACAEICVTELLHNTSCTRHDWECLCGHGLVSNDIGYCFESHCMPNVKDYLTAQNVTTADCGVVDREQRPLVKVASITLGLFALAAVVLRLLERSGRRHKWRERVDDWVMLLNGGFVVAFTVVGIMLDQEGMGRDSYTLPFSTLELLMKLLIAHEILYVTIVMMTKLSILFVYMRIFPLSIMPRLRICIPITMVVVTAAGLGEGLPVVFQCTPVDYFWDRLRDARGGHCLNFSAWGWANGGINVALDVWIIGLPLPELIRLRLHWKKKIKAVLMCIAGGLGLLVAIPRLIAMDHFQRSGIMSTNPTWRIPWISFFSVLEAYISVICACLPRIYILFSRLYHKYGSPSNTDSQKPLGTYPAVATVPYMHPRHNIDPESCPHNMPPQDNTLTLEAESGSTETHTTTTTDIDYHSMLGELHRWTSQVPCTPAA